MKKIKFRGRDIETGKYIYGSYHYENCDEGRLIHGIIPEWNPNIELAVTDVTQLVGEDKNGREVYEGDIIVDDEDATEFVAGMNHVHTVRFCRLKDSARRKIKFRGIDLETGDYVYGYVSDWVGTNQLAIYNPLTGKTDLIHNESLAQFAGYDKNGREVYEGDVLRMIRGDEVYDYVVSLRPMAWTADGCYIGESQFRSRELVQEKISEKS